MSEVPVLSFPAILRNPGLNNRFAHLHGPAGDNNGHKQASVKSALKKNRRDQNEGKRWVRRKDNGQLPFHLVYQVTRPLIYINAAILSYLEH